MVNLINVDKNPSFFQPQDSFKMALGAVLARALVKVTTVAVIIILFVTVTWAQFFPGTGIRNRLQPLTQSAPRQLNAAYLPGLGTFLQASSPGPPVLRPPRDMSRKEFVGEDGSKCSYVQMKGAALPGRIMSH